MVKWLEAISCHINAFIAQCPQVQVFASSDEVQNLYVRDLSHVLKLYLMRRNDT
jgi:hypothetical protein